MVWCGDCKGCGHRARLCETRGTVALLALFRQIEAEFRKSRRIMVGISLKLSPIAAYPRVYPDSVGATENCTGAISLMDDPFEQRNSHKNPSKNLSALRLCASPDGQIGRAHV